MNWHEYPLLRILFAFLCGILCYYFFPQVVFNTYILLSISLFLTAFAIWFPYDLMQFKYSFLRGIALSISIGIAGLLVADSHNVFQRSNYVGHHLHESQYFQGKIIEVPEQKEKSVKVVLALTNAYSDVDDKECDGKVILYLQNDLQASSLAYGDRIFFPNKLNPISAPGNPEAFDYKAYMKLKRVEYQAYLQVGEWKILNEKSPKGIVYFSLKVRAYLMRVLQKNGIDGDEYAVATALLLGQRGFLSEEMQEIYSGVGAMHVLCVSGLHVGMIFVVLSNLFRFLDRKKKGRLIRLGIILLALWFYAFITGLSPSVMRATTMFSFVSIGANLNRKTHIYNSLSASALFLLIIDPNLLFQLGFQLSYVAVWSIVAFQPVFYKLWTPKYLILDKAWALVTVSIAAQIGTAPLSIYYFHQFPNYFLLTNIIVIPLAWVIINLGIIVLLVSFIPVICVWASQLLSFVIKVLNYLMEGISNLPFSVTTDIPLHQNQLILFIALTVGIGIWILQKRKRWVYLNLSLLLLVVVQSFFVRMEAKSQKELVIYQLRDGLAVSAIWGRNQYLIGDSILFDSTVVKHSMYNHWMDRRVKDREVILLEESPKGPLRYPVINFLDKQILILDDSISKMKSQRKYSPDILLVMTSKIRKPKEFLTLYKPKEVVLGSTMYSSKAKLWKAHADSLQIPVWDIREQGYYSITEERTTRSLLSLFEL